MPEAANFIETIKTKFGNNPPKVILDLGSRDLGQSIEFTEAFPDARVIAFEPNPDMLGICRERKTRYPNIELYEIAVGDEDSVINFYSVQGNPGASSTLKPIENDFILGATGYRVVSGVPIRRLDTFLPEIGVDTVEVVWMDIQGVELRALKGMGKFFDNVKMLHTEAAQRAYYEGHVLKPELEQWLHERDFDTEFVGHWQQHTHGEADLICIKRSF